MVHAMETLLHAQSVANRTTSTIQPDSVFRHHPDSLDDDRAIVLPFANRVAIEAWLSNFLPHEHASIYHFGKLSPIRPDHAPCLPILIQDCHFVLVLHDLSLYQLIKVCSSEPQRLAPIPRIVVLCRKNLIRSDRRL